MPPGKTYRYARVVQGRKMKPITAQAQAGIRTYAMIAPLLPGAEALPELLAGKVDYVRLDRMNYHNADWVYRKYGLLDKLSDEYFEATGRQLTAAFSSLGIEICD